MVQSVCMLRFVASIIHTLFFPLTFIWQALSSQSKGIFGKSVSVLFALVVLFPIWLISYVIIGLGTVAGFQLAGLAPVKIEVSGASMLPTFNESGFIEVKRYPQFEFLQQDLQRGDIVVFNNSRTQEAFAQEGDHPYKPSGGFVKRIIGIPGDTIEIRDGFVQVNGEMIEEPYINKARSTFGGEEVEDCELITVPENQYFVMGDNRKVSLDSREIGFIAFQDVQFYLPLAEQSSYSSRWRDASEDANSAFDSQLDIKRYVELINEKRIEAGVEPLRYEPRLNQSAQFRAEYMLENNDLSSNSTNSDYTIQDSFRDAGYSNIVYSELHVLGYYDEDELITSFFEYPDTADYLLDEEFDDIGVSTFVGVLNGCPVQIVNQHLAGFRPPNYEQNLIDSWRNGLDTLLEVEGGWKELENNEAFYEENTELVDRMNSIIETRIVRLTAIVNRLEANEWLTAEEEQWMEEDKNLVSEQNDLAEQLNEAIENFTI